MFRHIEKTIQIITFAKWKH